MRSTHRLGKEEAVPGSVLAIEELDAQHMDLLPSRETLFRINVTPVIGVNISLALNAASIGTTAQAFAGQQLLSLQR
jgi:hypothetical protein